MSDLIALNASRRVVIVPPGAGRRSRAWSLQHLAPGGAWQGKGLVRSVGALRALVKAHAGPVDPLAVAILAALPARSDIPPRRFAAARREPRA